MAGGKPGATRQTASPSELSAAIVGPCGPPLQTHGRGEAPATPHVVMGAVVLTISGSPGLEYPSGRAWDKANFMAWSAQLRAFNQIPGIR